MTVTLVTLACLMALFIGWLLRQSINVRPWQAGAVTAPVLSAPRQSLINRRMGLVVLFAVIMSFFALIISAYLMRMLYPDWQQLRDPGLLWVNTGVLFLASVGLQLAANAALRGEAGKVRAGLLFGGAATLAFMAGQWIVWGQLQADGYYLADNPANSFFYMITALHALHLLGGLVAWLRPTLKVWRGDKLSAASVSIEACAWYWHVLLLIWLVLFALLLAT